MTVRAVRLALAIALGFAGSAAARPVGTPLEAALFLSPDSSVIVAARGPRDDVARSQAGMRRRVASRPCLCPMPDAWTFLEVIGPAEPGRLVLIDGKGRQHEPADPCALGGSGRSPFAQPAALNFAFHGIRLEDMRRATWRGAGGQTDTLARVGGE